MPTSACAAPPRPTRSPLLAAATCSSASRATIRSAATLANDWLFAGQGNDTANGGDGNDKLYLAEGDDTADGGAGNDRVFGGLGADVITLGDGNDQGRAGSGNDTVDGGLGNDIIFAGPGVDSIKGGEGNDKLGRWRRPTPRLRQHHGRHRRPAALATTRSARATARPTSSPVATATTRRTWISST